MKLTRRDFLKGVTSTIIASTALPNFSNVFASDMKSSILGEKLSRVWKKTTLGRTLIPYSEKGFSAGKGESMVLQQGGIKRSIEPGNLSRSLLFFGHITDTHVVDEESPGRLVAAEPLLEIVGVGSAFHPQEDLTLYVLDSMIRTLNEIHSKAPLDFIINTGDSVDNTQENELSSFLDTIEGKWVNPDSGADENPTPDPDGNDPFLAAGLPSGLPWYSTIGNHDILLQGNIPLSLLSIYNKIVGSILWQFVIKDHTGSQSNAVIKPWVTPPEPRDLVQGSVVADPLRRPLSPKEFISIHINRTNERISGFPSHLLGADYAYYSLLPKADVPIRFIFLDTANRFGFAQGCLSEAQVQGFLIPELEKAKSNGELVVVVSHHPSADIISFSALKDYIKSNYASRTRDENMRGMLDSLLEYLDLPTGGLGGKNFTTLLKSYPNVILHIVGHKHSNQIVEHKLEDGTHSYWEIQSASLLTYPQQARLFEILYDGEGQGSIQTCIVDHDSATGSLPYISRQRAYEDSHRKLEYGGYEGTPSDRNVALYFTVPDKVRENLARK